MVYFRHLRRRHAERIRHAKDLEAFITTEAARLTVSAAKATGTLTLGANPGDTKVAVIGTKTYTFQSSLSEADGHVKIGADATASATNLTHAINATGGTKGTDYATANVANADFVATNPSAGVVVITAKANGARTDATTCNATTCSWGHTTVTGGAAQADFDTLDSLQRNTAAEIAAAANAGALD